MPDWRRMTLTPEGREMLEGADDGDFCVHLIQLLTEPDSEGTLHFDLLFEPWVLRRLVIIRQRDPVTFHGAFMVPSRQRFAKYLSMTDLFAAMQAVGLPPEDAYGDSTTTGDIPGEQWAEEIAHLAETGIPLGVSTGWMSLDHRYRVRRGEWTLVTGLSSNFKSTFVQMLCIHLAIREGWHFGIWTGEHQRNVLGNNLIQQYIGEPVDGPNAMSPERFQQGLRWVTEHFHAIDPPEEQVPTVAWLLATARGQVQRHGIQGLVLDPWNEMQHTFGDRTETQYISDTLTQIRRFARHWQVHPWVVAHPRKIEKAQKGRYAGKHPPPTPFDVQGSSTWWAKSDNALCVWRDIDRSPTALELHVQKVRFRGALGLGEVQLELDTTSGRIVEPDQDPHWQDTPVDDDDELSFLR